MTRMLVSQLHRPTNSLVLAILGLRYASPNLLRSLLGIYTNLGGFAHENGTLSHQDVSMEVEGRLMFQT